MIGGQALIEGILMRGPRRQAIVCRGAEGLVEKVEDFTPLKEKHPVLGWPFLRGVAVFLSSMANGMKALTFSADQLPEDQQEEPGKFDLWVEKKFGSEKAQKIFIGTAVVLGIALSIALFILLPTFLVGLIPNIKGHTELRSLLEGATKLVIFFLYLWLCTNVKEVSRLFAYHGAEHKTIFCYEHGKELTVDNVRPESRFHPRCGTSFLFVVIIVSILVSSIVFPYIDWQNIWVRIGVTLLLLIPVVGVTYEFNRFVGAHDNVVTRILSAPGMWMQNFTTNEPDDSMLEVAIEALKLVLPEEQGKDAW